MVLFAKLYFLFGLVPFNILICRNVLNLLASFGMLLFARHACDLWQYEYFCRQVG